MVGQIVIRLNALGVPMHRDMSLLPLKKVKKVNIRISNPVKSFHVCISTKIRVCKRVLMKQEEYFIGTYARHAFRLRAKLMPTHRQIVVNPSQKISNSHTEDVPTQLGLYTIIILITMLSGNFKILIKM